jgi:uncharacterized protein involved in response to NO
MRGVFFATPFRPFFLLAGVMAAVWIPLWIMVLLYGTTVDSSLGPIGWHAHEMVFGYTGAVLAGFLLTAARNWTKRPTVEGASLAALVAVWIACRAVALFSARLPDWLPLVVDGGFWLGLIVALARPLIAARSKRNLPFVGLLAVVGGGDLAMHLIASGHLSFVWAPRAMAASLDAITLVILIFGGRIIPMFTGSAVGIKPRGKGLLDWIGLSLVGGLLVAHLAIDASAATYWLAIVAGGLNLVRLWGWGGSRTARKPILWVLHIGWALLTGSFVAQGAAGLSSSIPAISATHLLTVGGIGVITLGMMARVSLGHTGRPLVAPTSTAVAFALLIVAALVRAGAPIFTPDWYADALRVTGAAWAVAFGLFAARYAPIWLSARADGKPG